MQIYLEERFILTYYKGGYSLSEQGFARFGVPADVPRWLQIRTEATENVTFLIEKSTDIKLAERDSVIEYVDSTCARLARGQIGRFREIPVDGSALYEYAIKKIDVQAWGLFLDSANQAVKPYRIDYTFHSGSHGFCNVCKMQGWASWDTVGDVKRYLQEVYGYKSKHMLLALNDQILQDSLTLGSYEVGYDGKTSMEIVSGDEIMMAIVQQYLAAGGDVSTSYCKLLRGFLKDV